MLKSSSDYEMTIRHQYDRICCLALKCEAIDYFRRINIQRKREVMFCEMSEAELNRLYTMDQYRAEKHQMTVLGYEIEITDDLLAEALKVLTKRKRDIILLSFFQGMSDAEIARRLDLVRSTVNEHKKRSLEILKNFMEKGYKNDETK